MKESENEVKRNSEILLIYGAKLCNPNGDPDEENKPRLDIKTQINLVSDLRLKRYFRDYVIQKFGEKYIYVGTVKGESVPSDERGWSLMEQWGIDIKKEETEKWIKLIPKLCVDVRLFGATIAVRGRDKTKGVPINFTGPLQFSWGYSLHPVELVESSTITSVFVGRESEEETEKRYGTMGKDWRVYYSLIAFYGVVSGLRACKTGMRNIDLELFDNFIWDSIKLQATTRSKIGEVPHLYLRVEYKDSNTLEGDLRKFVKVEYGKIIRDFEDIKLDFSILIEKLKENKDKIEAVYLRISNEMKKYELEEKLKEIFKERYKSLPHSQKELQEKELIEKVLAPYLLQKN